MSATTKIYSSGSNSSPVVKPKVSVSDITDFLLETAKIHALQDTLNQAQAQLKLIKTPQDKDSLFARVKTMATQAPKVSIVPKDICDIFGCKQDSKEMLILMNALTDLLIEINHATEQENNSPRAQVRALLFLPPKTAEQHEIYRYTKKLLTTCFNTNCAAEKKSAISEYENLCGQTSGWNKFKRVALAVTAALSAFFIVGFFACLVSAAITAAVTGFTAYHILRHTSLFKPPLEAKSEEISKIFRKDLNNQTPTFTPKIEKT